MKLCSPALFGHKQAEYMVGCDKLILAISMAIILFWCYCCCLYCRPTFTSVAPPVDEVEATKRSQPVLASWPATLPCVHNVSTMCRVVWCVTILNQPFLVSTMCLRRVVWCLTFWTNPSLCPHSELNRVYNVWCLQIMKKKNPSTMSSLQTLVLSTLCSWHWLHVYSFLHT